MIIGLNGVQHFIYFSLIGNFINFGDDSMMPNYYVSLLHRSPKHNAIIHQKASMIGGNGIIKNSLSNASQKGKVHPTQKPVALLEYLIKTYTQEGETVLDFTAWSWTLWCASQNTNRKFILIEKDEWYFNITCDRLIKNQERLDLLDFTSFSEIRK